VLYIERCVFALHTKTAKARKMEGITQRQAQQKLQNTYRMHMDLIFFSLRLDDFSKATVIDHSMVFSLACSSNLGFWELLAHANGIGELL